jgi:hypothetical protein
MTEPTLLQISVELAKVLAPSAWRSDPPVKAEVLADSCHELARLLLTRRTKELHHENGLVIGTLSLDPDGCFRANVDRLELAEAPDNGGVVVGRDLPAVIKGRAAFTTAW